LKNLLRCNLGVLLVLVLFLLCPGLVYAIGNPDYITIGDVYVFRNVVDEGDQLYFCRYDVSYNSVPDEDAGDTWEMALYDSTGDLVATRPLNYYQHNIISIYLESDVSLGWQGAHQVIIRGMPSVFGNLTEGVNMKTRALAPGDYYEVDYLAGVMITQAGILEDDWEITLLSSGDRLNSTGKTFFLAAVPGLGDMVPDIFEVITGGMEVDYKAYDQTYREALSTNQGSRLEEAITGIGKMMGVYNPEWTSFWLVSLVLLMVVGVISSGTGTPGWAFVGGYSVLALGAFIFGGNLFTLVMVLGVVAAVIFGLFFVLGRFA